MWVIEVETDTDWAEVDQAHNKATAESVARKLSADRFSLLPVRFRELGSPYTFTVKK